MSVFFSKNSIAWYFIIPVLAIHFMVVALPSLLSLALCLTDWNGFGKINYVGLENFYELFDDRYFKKAVWHNIIWTCLFLTVPIALALTCAYLLTGITKGQMLFRLCFFFPYMLASIINFYWYLGGRKIRVEIHLNENVGTYLHIPPPKKKTEMIISLNRLYLHTE